MKKLLLIFVLGFLSNLMLGHTSFTLRSNNFTMTSVTKVQVSTIGLNKGTISIPSTSKFSNNIKNSNTIQSNNYLSNILDESINIKSPMTLNDQDTIYIEVSGKLFDIFNQIKRDSIINLKILGNLDARDFVTLNYFFPNLTKIDLSEIKITEYYGVVNQQLSEFNPNEIPASAFAFNNTLKEIILPNSIKSIGISSFKYSIIEKVNFPQSITSIKQDAFAYSNLTGELDLPDSLKYIGANAFYNCKSLIGSIVIKTLTDTIEHSAFQGCSGFNGNLILKSQLKYLGDYSFADCSNLKGNIILPNTLLNTGNFTFQNCTGFDGYISFPDSLKIIGIGCFDHCYNLKSKINLPPTLKEIGGSAFNYCRNIIDSVILPNSINRIGGNAFGECYNLDGVIKFPDSISKIEDRIFFYCTNIKGKLIIPKGVKSIGNESFNYCSKISELFLPEAISQIGDKTFERCFSIRRIVVDAISPPIIGQTIFPKTVFDTVKLEVPFGCQKKYKSSLGWSNFVNVIEKTIPSNMIRLYLNIGQNGTVIINNTAFRGIDSILVEKHSDLQMTIFPDSGFLVSDVSKDGNSIRYLIDDNKYFTTLALDTKISFNFGVKNKDIYVENPGYLSANITIDDANTIKNLKIRGRINVLDFNYIRDNLKNLIRLDLKETKIDAYNDTIYIWGTPYSDFSANSIPENAFYYPIGSVSYGMDSISEVILPDSIISIGNNAFRKCTHLKTINIPATIITIGNSAFETTGLIKIEIPKGIKKMGAYTFKNCRQLNEIITHSEAPNDIVLGGWNFLNVFTSDCILYVPKGSINLYKSLTEWKEFINIREIEEITTKNCNVLITNSIPYPNPTKDYINITGVQNGTIRITDLNGKLILEQELNNTNKIDLQNVYPGVYLYRIQSSEGAHNGKIIKE